MASGGGGAVNWQLPRWKVVGYPHSHVVEHKPLSERSFEIANTHFSPLPTPPPKYSGRGGAALPGLLAGAASAYGERTGVGAEPSAGLWDLLDDYSRN